MATVANHIQPADLGFFATLASCGSLTAAARELGISTPAVSKHLSLMEARLGVALVTRTTRRMSMTPEGELYLEHARRVLREIDAMSQSLGSAKLVPQGLVRVNATLGFGRSAIAPIVSKFVRRFPEIEVQLQLSVDPPLIVDDAFDVCVRFGEPPDARVIARRLAANQRVLCASPAYFERRERPKKPRDLAAHNCIGIRQGGDAFGIWRLSSGRGEHRRTDAVRVQGNLVTNDGEIAVKWALEGHGIVMRAHWDVAALLRSGRLVQVLPSYQTPDADIFAVYPQRLQHAPRVRAFVDFLAESLAPR